MRAMIEASQFKRGQAFHFKGEPVTVVDVQFSTPTARGASPIAKTKLRSLTTGKLFKESIRVSEKFEEVDIELRPCSYLYSDADRWHFMDSETFDQFGFAQEDLGALTGFITEGLEGIRAMLLDGKIVSLSLPQAVDLKVVETDPALKGATAQAQTKPATLETGLVIQVPPYLETGEMVRVDTRDGHFIERAK
jgi:elongation factor P